MIQYNQYTTELQKLSEELEMLVQERAELVSDFTLSSRISNAVSNQHAYILAKRDEVIAEGDALIDKLLVERDVLIGERRELDEMSTCEVEAHHRLDAECAEPLEASPLDSTLETFADELEQALNKQSDSSEEF